MDLLTHAVVGAITGHAFGHQAVGAAVAIAPDIFVVFRRKELATRLHNATHSFAFTCTLTALAATLDRRLAMCVAMSLLSHLLLDCVTNKHEWGPALFCPFIKKKFTFEMPWWVGLISTFTWCNLAILIAVK